MTSKELAIFERRLEEWEARHPRVSLSGDAARIISRQADKIIDAQRKAADRVVVSQERGFDRVASEVSRVYDGIMELGAAFEWGFSELIWQAEQQTETLKQILEVLQAPLDTQGKELRRRAENAYANRWFDDALEDFLDSERKNRYDFTVHISLGHIYFFEKKNPEKAMEYYDKAVKYATPESPQHASYGLLHIGLINYLRADFQKAYEAVLRATELSPNFAEAHFQCAQYCANLGRYDKAIEHLKKATLADRNYALKVWAEKDFDVMKAKLRSFFEQWRKETLAGAEKAMEKVRVFLSDAESYDAGHTPSYIEAKKDLSRAEALLKSASLFDCWDATRKVSAAFASAIKIPSEYAKVPSKYFSEEIEEKRLEIEGRQRLIEAEFGNWSFVVIIILAVIAGILTGNALVAIMTFAGILVSIAVVWNLIRWIWSNQVRAAKKELNEILTRQKQKVEQDVVYLQSKAQQLEEEELPKVSVMHLMRSPGW